MGSAVELVGGDALLKRDMFRVGNGAVKKWMKAT
jgi:hypothetical protein